MDYILFNSDGSINKEQTHLNQYIMQDENNKKIEIKVDGIEAPGNLVAELFCTLPNNQTVVLIGSWSDERLGWIVTITGNVTLYNGTVLAAVRIRDQETGVVRVMFPFTLVINKTGIKPEEDTGVTLEELDSFLDLVRGWASDVATEYLEQLHIKNGTGTNAIQQDMADATVDFTGRNPNAIAADPTLAAEIPTGASANQTSAFGKNTMSRATAATAMGNKCLADAEESLSQGYQCVTLRGADGSHAQGNETTTGGKCAHSEGLYTQAMEDESHSEGNSTATYAKWGHSEGVFTTVKGNYIITVHDVDPSPIPPEPVTPTPTPEELDALNGVGAHSEGHYNFSFGLGSHTEGHGNKGYARFSHAEGGSNQAGPDLVLRKTEDGKDYYTIDHTKQYQHASGYQTKAIGTASYTGGWGTIAGYDFQTAIGKWNANKQDTLFEVGNGADNNNRGNAFEVHSDGRATIGASPTNDMDVVSKKYFESHLKTINGQPIHGTGNVTVSVEQTGLFFHDMMLEAGQNVWHVQVIDNKSDQYYSGNMQQRFSGSDWFLKMMIEDNGVMSLVTRVVCTADSPTTIALDLMVAGATYHNVTISGIVSIIDDIYPYNP